MQPALFLKRRIHFLIYTVLSKFFYSNRLPLPPSPKTHRTPLLPFRVSFICDAKRKVAALTSTHLPPPPSPE